MAVFIQISNIQTRREVPPPYSVCSNKITTKRRESFAPYAAARVYFGRRSLVLGLGTGGSLAAMRELGNHRTRGRGSDVLVKHVSRDVDHMYVDLARLGTLSTK